MRTRRCLAVVVMMLALAAPGAVAAQAKAGDKKAKAAAQAPGKKAKADKAQKQEPPAKAEAQAAKPAAAPTAAGKAAAADKQAEPATAAAAAGAEPQAAEPGTAPEPAAAPASAPAGQGDRKFFQQEKHPYRFLQRSEGHYFRGQRTGPRPTGPAPRLEPEPPRVRGDAGAAIGIGLSFEQDWNRDEGYDLFGEDDVAQRVSVWFSHDLLSFGERTVLAGELGVGSGVDETSGEFDSMKTSLNNTRLQVAAYVRHAIWPVLQPHLRLAGHVSFIKAELDFAGDENFSDRDISGGGSLGAGFMVRTPTRLFENRKGDFASLSLGLLFEGGYTLASPVTFDLVDDEQADRIEVRSARLGELELSGPYFRAGLVVRF